MPIFLLRSSNHLVRVIAAVACLTVSTTASATLIDLTGEGNQGDNTPGNSLSFSQGGINLTVTAFGETGPIDTTAPPIYWFFEDAQVYSWGTGIGVCNRQELANGCSTNEHEVDTVGRDDLVAFYFDQTVNFENLTVDPYNGPGSDPNDRNIIYWVGNAPAVPDLSAETFFTLGALAGFAAEVESGASSGYAPYTHSLSGTGNILLLTGDYHDLYCKNSNSTSNSECEAYKIQNIKVSVVPLPATLPLFASALLSAGFVARRRTMAI